jgi:hypothetical protein
MSLTTEAWQALGVDPDYPIETDNEDGHDSLTHNARDYIRDYLITYRVDVFRLVIQHLERRSQIYAEPSLAEEDMGRTLIMIQPLIYNLGSWRCTRGRPLVLPQ